MFTSPSPFTLHHFPTEVLPFILQSELSLIVILSKDSTFLLDRRFTISNYKYVCALYFSVFGLFHHYRLNCKGDGAIASDITHTVLQNMVEILADEYHMCPTQAACWALRHEELHCYAPITKYFILMPMKSNHIVSNRLPMKPVFYILILSICII